MRKLNAIGGIVTLIVVGAMLFVGCKPASTPATQGLIRIGILKHESSLPFYVADEKGLFKKHGLDVIFFMPPNYTAMLEAPHARIEKKDHDFAIGVSVSASLNCAGQEKGEVHHFQIPAVAIECKTYLDKTMLEGSSTAAEQLKFRNPNALYLVVSEWLKLTGNVNLRKFKVDQIYVLRKQKNTDREFRFLPDYEKNPIHLDVVEHLFKTVRTHLTSNWEGGVAYGLERGYLL
jgi:hypothetical protein